MQVEPVLVNAIGPGNVPPGQTTAALNEELQEEQSVSHTAASQQQSVSVAMFPLSVKIVPALTMMAIYGQSDVVQPVTVAKADSVCGS